MSDDSPWKCQGPHDEPCEDPECYVIAERARAAEIAAVITSAPKQIESVVGVDRMDSLDRQGLDPRIKLQLLAAETKTTTGQDPRSGGHAIVGRPRVILQLLLDMGGRDGIKLERPVIIGSAGGDVVGWWQDVPIIVRCNVVDDRLWCLKQDLIPESKMIDRRRAGELRLNAHGGTLMRLKE